MIRDYEPDRIVGLTIHADIDCSMEQYTELCSWWSEQMRSMLTELHGSDWRESLSLGWAHHRDDLPTLGRDADPHAFEEFARFGEGGWGSNTVSASLYAPPYGSIRLGVSSLPSLPEKVELSYTVTVPHSRRDTIGGTLTAAAERFTRSWSPLYLGISDDSSTTSVALDKAQNVNSHVARLDSSTYLRSYSWVTCVPELLLSRLGTMQSMAESGAFFRVSTTPGGLIVQATEHFSDYYGARVRAVRDALEPVLRQRPTKYHPRKAGLRIAWDDGRNGPLPADDSWRRRTAHE